MPPMSPPVARLSQVKTPKLSFSSCIVYDDSKQPVCFTPSSASLLHQRCPESHFHTPAPLLFQNYWIRVQKCINFENWTPVQTPDTIDTNKIQQWFYLSFQMTCIKIMQIPDTAENDKRPWVRFFTKFWLRIWVLKKLRILPESTPDPWSPLYYTSKVPPPENFASGNPQPGNYHSPKFSKSQ